MVVMMMMMMMMIFFRLVSPGYGRQAIRNRNRNRFRGLGHAVGHGLVREDQGDEELGVGVRRAEVFAHGHAPFGIELH